MEAAAAAVPFCAQPCMLDCDSVGCLGKRHADGCAVYSHAIFSFLGHAPSMQSVCVQRLSRCVCRSKAERAAAAPVRSKGGQFFSSARTMRPSSARACVPRFHRSEGLAVLWQPSPAPPPRTMHPPLSQGVPSAPPPPPRTMRLPLNSVRVPRSSRTVFLLCGNNHPSFPPTSQATPVPPPAPPRPPPRIMRASCSRCSFVGDTLQPDHASLFFLSVGARAPYASVAACAALESVRVPLESDAF